MSNQLRLVGTSVRRRHGYQRNATERRLTQLRIEGNPVDVARAALLRDLADTIDRERGRLTEDPDTSGHTLGRLLVSLAELWDAWDTGGGEDRDPWDELARRLSAAAAAPHPPDTNPPH